MADMNSVFMGYRTRAQISMASLNIFAYRRRIQKTHLESYVFDKTVYSNKALFIFRFDDIVEGKTSREGILVMHDVKDRKSVNKIQEIHMDPVFRLYTEHEKILDIVECFTGPNILSIHSMLIAKPPDIGFGSSR